MEAFSPWMGKLTGPIAQLYDHRVWAVEEQGLPILQGAVSNAFGAVPGHGLLDGSHLGCPAVWDERLIQQGQAVPHRRRAVDSRDRARIVHQLKAAQARRENARPALYRAKTSASAASSSPKHRVGAAVVQPRSGA